MSKRKRGSDSGLNDILVKYEDEIFRAIKKSKGLERQRLSKRLRDRYTTPEKTQRLEQEIVVLKVSKFKSTQQPLEYSTKPAKSLDLHQTARVHLYTSLLKVNSIAASPDLPNELRRGVSKPELPEEEKKTLHNVTSGLYNTELVKQATDQAVKAVCSVLNVALPENSKRARKDERKFEEEQPSDRMASKIINPEVVSGAPEGKGDGGSDDESVFEGFSSDMDEPRHVLGVTDGDNETKEATDCDNETKEAAEFDQLNDLLGSSSDEEEDWNDDKYAQFRGRETVNLDDISSGSGEESGAESESDSQGVSQSPPPTPRKEKKEEKKSVSATKSGSIAGSTFLPSLMGGYISGSESASDIEEEKPKKRRGQRARQAIWEQKYGARANHLQKPTKGGSRDSGWDMQRGAVDGDDDRGGRTHWKRGTQRPGVTNGSRHGFPGGHREDAPAPKPRKRDDQGTLHPSWEARRKARETQKAVTFTGQKVVFE
ncbi:bud site selection protein 22 [Conoideocrella luteorostrata]|uniref:Bud site selection protein 22 n=1 Tax=Conoideocrella luteorostrata TaxID=1105319 RepID=A0AAJ0FP88_9HYPO|nr:bud site selection protein 22 [Conoideocrella luteorostrata]